MPESVLDILACIQGASLLILLVWASVLDLRKGRVDNWLCVAGLVLGLALSYMRGGLSEGAAGTGVSLVTSVLSMLIGLLVFGLFYLTGGLGGGDVKLIAAVGALSASPHFMLWVMACTAFAGFPLAIAALCSAGDLKGGLRRTMKSFFRLRRKRPRVEGAEDAPAGTDSACNDGVESDRAKASPGADEPAVTVPYAVAICLGCLLAAWLYVDRGAGLPFLPAMG